MEESPSTTLESDATFAAGACVRVLEPPLGASMAKFRGRAGVVVYGSAGGSLVVVAVERAASETVIPTLLAENAFEFLAVEPRNLRALEEGEKAPSAPSWRARKRGRGSTKQHPAAAPTRARRVAVIVPFKDAHAEQKRSAHLAKFIPFMVNFLARFAEDYRILIVEQSDDGKKFNRGKLLNIGYRLAVDRYDCDSFIFHDVDLLPSDDLGVEYATRPQRGVPVHIARVWSRYNDNASYVGGIAAWNATDFETINGFPNNYWGWGGEDDEMMRRCLTVWGEGFRMASPESGSIVDLEDMDLQEKLSFIKEHPEWKCNVRWELRSEHAATWQHNGLRQKDRSIDFEVLTTADLGDRAFKLTVTCTPNDDWSDAKAPIEQEA